MIERSPEWWADRIAGEPDLPITAGRPGALMQPGWEARFEAMKAEANAKAAPPSGERLHGFDDLVVDHKLPDGTRMTLSFVDAVRGGSAEQILLEALNAYIELPNILRRKTTRSGMLWHGLSPAKIGALEAIMLAEAAARRRA